MDHDSLAVESGLTDAELKDIGEGGNFSQSQLLKVMMATDLGATASTMPIPFYVIQGRDDLYTPTEPAIAYFNSVRAPKKDLVVIEGAGHFALTTNPDEFLQALAKVGLVH